MEDQSKIEAKYFAIPLYLCKHEPPPHLRVNITSSLQHTFAITPAVVLPGHCRNVIHNQTSRTNVIQTNQSCSDAFESDYRIPRSDTRNTF